MRAALAGRPDRQAVLLVHRHHRVVAAAALNPLLIPVREAIAYLVERWADEEPAGGWSARRCSPPDSWPRSPWRPNQFGALAHAWP
jgi:hypothetical protein